MRVMNLKIKRELIKNILFSLDVHGLVSDPKSAETELNAMAERLSPLFPLRARLSCSAIAEACAPMLGEAPER